MTLRTIAMISAIFFLLSFSAGIGRADSGDIRWYSFKEGMAQQEKLRKKAFLHFWAKWCPSCRKMNEVTFTDRSVIAYLNKHFISIKINSEENKTLASEFGVRGIPDNWFIAENNQPISDLPGYIPPKMFLAVLKFILTDSYKKISFTKFMETM